MNIEILGLITIITSGVLFRLGGMGFPPFKKGWRRFILPIFLGIIGIMASQHKIELLCAVIGSGVAFSLPYGSKTPYWLKCIVAVTFTLPVLFLGFTIWIIIVPILFITLFILSNWKKTQGEFGHAITEILTGIGIGITWARVLHLV